MLNAISNVTQTPNVTESTNPNSKPAQSKPSGASTTDTVHLSSVAQSLIQEATETPAQTAREAAGGDVQARRLLAKEAADKPH
jgi:hypothetical protein